MSEKKFDFSGNFGFPELYHDQALYFLNKTEPDKNDELIIRLRAAKGSISAADLCIMTEGEGEITEHRMSNIGSFVDKTGRYEFYETAVCSLEKPFFYCFRICSVADNEVYYYSQLTGQDSFEKFSLPKEMPLKYPDIEKNGWYIRPGYKGPSWAAGISWYSIMPDAFYNGDPTNDDMQSDENYDQPWNLNHVDLRDRYGGDFQGIMDKADYIKELGCDGVFYDPIQKAEQNAGYGTDDFDQIESTFGNADKYSEFIEYMHGKGLRLMQDVVVYFAPSNGMLINRLDRWPTPRLEAAKKGESLNKESPYYDMFCDADNGGHPMWDGMTLNHCRKSVGDMLYGSPETPLLRYASKEQGFGVDGYRFDCGGWITGHDGTSDDYPWSGDQIKGRHSNERTERVMSTIYDRLRAVNPEFNVLSESSGNHQLRAGCWDSEWSLGLNANFEKLIDPERGGSLNDIYKTMVNSCLISKPRSVALCAKLQVNTHDQSRNYMRPEKFNAWKTARLIQMTYVGSPSVYYGEEHNFGGSTFRNRYGERRNGFSYFDWDESKWDYRIHNFFKAMLELRREYPAVKTGAYVHLGHNDDSIDYARFDENGTVITLTNQTDETIGHTVNAASCNLADGTVMTDWLTGEEFNVKNGMLDVDVIPGGRILVNGGRKTSSFRLGFAAVCLEDGKKADCSGDVAIETENSVTIAGADMLKFYSLPAFASFEFAVRVNGVGTAIIRNGLHKDSICYKAEHRNGIVTVFACGKVLTTAECDGNIVICRAADNTFSVKGIEGSEIKLPMNDKVYVGFGDVDGKATFTNPEIRGFEERPLAESFNGVPAPMFNETDSFDIRNGHLVLGGNSEIATRSTDDDWTFKVKLAYLPASANDWAGVISKQDENNRVIAGRMYESGNVYLFAAKTSGGVPVITEKLLDAHPESEIILQLQRIGTFYTAVYSYDGECWHSLGDSIFMNLCVEHPGVQVHGKTAATIDYVSFGDAINDGKSFFTPFTPTLPEPLIPYNERMCKYKIRFVGKEWEKAPEGYRNPDVSDGQIAVINKEYKNFRAEASFRVLGGNGWAGFTFGKPFFDSSVDSAYSLRLNVNGVIKLCKGNIEIASATAPETHMQTRLVLEVKGDRAVVYSGRKAEPVIMTELSGYNGGYFSFATGDAAADVGNFNICSDKDRFYALGMWNYRVENRSIIATCEGKTSVFLRGVALTDYVLTTSVRLNRYKPESASAGLLLSNMYGIDNSHEHVGIYLSTDLEGNVRLKYKDEDLLPPHRLETTDVPVKFTVVKQGRKYTIYVGNSAKSVFEYEEPVLTGSVYSLESHNSNTVFSDIAICNIQRNTDPLTLDICSHLK